jgi:hypothetical protein
MISEVTDLSIVLCVLFLFLDMSNVEAHDLLATYGVKQFVGN